MDERESAALWHLSGFRNENYANWTALLFCLI